MDLDNTLPYNKFRSSYWFMLNNVILLEVSRDVTHTPKVYILNYTEFWLKAVLLLHSTVDDVVFPLALACNLLFKFFFDDINTFSYMVK